VQSFQSSARAGRIHHNGESTVKTLQTLYPPSTNALAVVLIRVIYPRPARGILEFSHSQEYVSMNNELIDLRLSAIEKAIKTLSGALGANEGPVSEDLQNQINILREQLGESGLTPKEEAVTYQTIRLLDPLQCDPWEPF